MKDKLDFIDDFLASCEDWMHGEDGKDVTICRKYLGEISQQLKNCSILNWSYFNDSEPNYRDLIIIVHPPEQKALPSIEIYDKNTIWIDGSKYALLTL